MFDSSRTDKSSGVLVRIALAVMIAAIVLAYGMVHPAEAAGSSASKQTKIEKRAKKILKKMTLRQKVGQILFVGAKGNDAANMKKFQYGGYLYHENNLNNNTKAAFRKRVKKVQKAAKIDAFIGADEEGGEFAAISSHKLFRKTPFKSPRELYRLGGYKRIVSDAKVKCNFLKDLGFNTNFAPVVDVPYGSNNYMWNRSFSSNHKYVSKYAKKVLAVMNKKKIVNSVKHFPGYGASGNTHTEVMVDNRSLSTLKKRDLKPFVTGIKSGCSMIMVSHNIVNCFDSSKPASISKAVHNYIRKDMGYDGIIISDSITMKGVTGFAKDSNALAVKTFNAGHDIVCAGSDRGYFKGMLAAAKSGKITKKRLNASVLRILKVKIQMGIIK